MRYADETPLSGQNPAILEVPDGTLEEFAGQLARAAGLDEAETAQWQAFLDPAEGSTEADAKTTQVVHRVAKMVTNEEGSFPRAAGLTVEEFTYATFLLGVRRRSERTSNVTHRELFKPSRIVSGASAGAELSADNERALATIRGVLGKLALLSVRAAMTDMAPVEGDAAKKTTASPTPGASAVKPKRSKRKEPSGLTGLEAMKHQIREVGGSGIDAEQLNELTDQDILRLLREARLVVQGKDRTNERIAQVETYLKKEVLCRFTSSAAVPCWLNGLDAHRVADSRESLSPNCHYYRVYSHDHQKEAGIEPPELQA